MGFVGCHIPRTVVTFGNFRFSYSLYSSPFTYPFILGLVLILPVQSVIYIGKHTLTVKDQHEHEHIIPATIVNNSGKTYRVCRIVLDKRTVVPPLTQVVVHANVQNVPQNGKVKM